MDRWVGRVAVVTGASSGIGAAIAKDLVRNGMTVVGLARRKNKIDEITKNLGGGFKEKLHSIECDLTKEDDILNAFRWIETNLGGVDVLVNNAGVAKVTMLMKADNSANIKEIVDVNIMGLCHCTREAIQSMNARNVAGHIFHMNSLLGHMVWNAPLSCPNGINMYAASKHAVSALTETLRLELAHAKSKIKVTSISPGVVKTEMYQNIMTKEEIDKHFAKVAHLLPEDISETLIFALSTAPHVQMHEITMKPVGALY